MEPREYAQKLRAEGVTTEVRGVRLLQRAFPLLERCEIVAAWQEPHYESLWVAMPGMFMGEYIAPGEPVFKPWNS